MGGEGRPSGWARPLKKGLKWLGIVAGVVVVLLACAVPALGWMADRRIHTTYDVDPEPIPIPEDPASIERGERLYTIWNCVECHGEDATGQVEDIPPGRMTMANLTLIANQWSSRDWVRAVRHGVTPSGRALMLMPAAEYNRMSDADLGAIIAYVRSIPQRGPPRGSPELNLLGKVFLELDLMPIPGIPAEIIDHEAPPPDPVPGPTADYGRYLATPCMHCHGETLAGGEKTFFPMPIANITPHETGIASWTREDFERLMRTGRRPDGSEVDQEMMSTERTGRYEDEELDALWAFLRSVPPRPYGEQE